MYLLLFKAIQTYIYNFSDKRIFPFATVVKDTGGAPWAANIYANFQKYWKQLQWDTQGLRGKTDSWKSEVKKLLVLSL
jgi:hypothetical protein